MYVIASYHYPLETIEYAGRTCYMSQDKITAGSAAKFVSKIKNVGHLSVLEHSRLIICEPDDMDKARSILYVVALEHPEIEMSTYLNGAVFSGNYRAWLDLLSALRKHCHNSGWWSGIGNCNIELVDELYELLVKHNPAVFADDTLLLSNTESIIQDISSKYHDIEISILDYCIPNYSIAEQHGAMTVRIKGGSRCLTHELVRHRKASFSQQSQRYVDESGFPYVIPEEIIHAGANALTEYTSSIKHSSEVYSKLQASYDLKKQIARYVLPNATVSEIVMTATWKWWKHFFSLRCSSKAQPEMQTIAYMIRDLSKTIYLGSF